MTWKFVRSFITGSYAYGRPTSKSDIDLVVFVDKDDLDKLNQIADKDHPHSEDENYIIAGGTSLRFGKLNLIVCTIQLYFEIWREGTKRLKKKAPVSRDEACRFFDQLRRSEGLSVPEDKKHKPQDYDDDISF